MGSSAITNPKNGACCSQNHALIAARSHTIGTHLTLIFYRLRMSHTPAIVVCTAKIPQHRAGIGVRVWSFQKGGRPQKDHAQKLPKNCAKNQKNKSTRRCKK
jgi:hypothetical protein